MAHFAEIDSNNIVLQVLVVPDEQEHRGQEYLSVDCNLVGTWKKTSYNTYGGVHTLGGTPYRKNYAGIGFTYDESRDAFIPPKPYDSWILDEETCLWNDPNPTPVDLDERSTLNIPSPMTE
jgi:hypothetical protein